MRFFTLQFQGINYQLQQLSQQSCGIPVCYVMSMKSDSGRYSGDRNSKNSRLERNSSTGSSRGGGVMSPVSGGVMSPVGRRDSFASKSAVSRRDSAASGGLLSPVSRRDSSQSVMSVGDHTELHDAAKKGDKALVASLIKDKISLVNKKNQDGHSAMHLAAAKGHTEICGGQG
eukprot:TRINITY_DN22940_c0_g2_i5.p1 TRINITY_DN22940_c0_g2~~TRINITY_DN22940_c0_g2_i5.p1  ORF type:complete len:173 (+),score=13.25 TRINITY_DN22940_c0_g2_i5:49-567(+)